LAPFRPATSILHVANGKVNSYGKVVFDSSLNTILASTAFEPDGEQAGVDLSFMHTSSESNLQKGIEISIGVVHKCSRSHGGTVKPGINILYRIERSATDTVRWRPQYEQSMESLVAATKLMDSEYVVLKVTDNS